MRDVRLDEVTIFVLKLLDYSYSVVANADHKDWIGWSLVPDVEFATDILNYTGSICVIHEYRHVLVRVGFVDSRIEQDTRP